MPEFVDSERAVRLMQLLAARYDFLALLGRGGSGLVFEVENRQLERREALKFLSQDLGRDGRQRFAHEAKIMAGLEHPHIVPIYAFGDDEDCLWYSMKLVEGPTLGFYLKGTERPTALEALQVAIPVLEALTLTHGRGIIHRDIKPANILLDPQAGPLLTDFGVAKMEGDPLKTETGMMLGTPAYVSPEQSLGKKLDGRTDLYALGVSLYQMLTGDLPFSGNSLSIFIQRLQEEAPALRDLRPDVPEAVAAVITRAMEREADQRFATAEEMREAFVQAADAGGMDWQKPLVVPEQAGPRREALPEYLAPTGVFREAGSDAVTSRTRVMADSSLPTSGRTGEKRRSRLVPALLAIAVLGLAAWGGLRSQWKAEVPPVAPPRAEPARGEPEPPTPVEPRPQAVAVPRKEVEAVPLRRAVTPARLLEVPRVSQGEGRPCAGQSITVEVQVDEKGAVTAARLLVKVQPECADSALKAARECRFSPALAADGQPVASTLAIAVEL